MAKKAKAKPKGTKPQQFKKNATEPTKELAKPKSKSPGRKPYAPLQRSKSEDGTRRGVPNVQYDHVDVPASRCKKCDSTVRTKYHRTYTKYLPHERDGQLVTHIVYRHCKCGDCGQARVDRCFENRPEWPQVDVEGVPGEENEITDAA